MDIANIHLHPNNNNPKRFRLQLKSMDLQEYFSFTQHGSKEAALLAAKKRRDELVKIHKLRQNLGFRKVFKDDGLIKGINLTVSNRRCYVLMSLITAADDTRAKRICERVITDDNFDEVFFNFLDQLLEIKKVTLDTEDKRQIKKIRMNYIRKFHDLTHKLKPAKQLLEEKIAAERENKPQRTKTAKTLFNDDGFIHYLYLYEDKKRKKVTFRLYFTAQAGHQNRIEKKVTLDNFHVLFSDLIQTKLEKTGYIITEEDKVTMDTARRKYRRKLGTLVRSWTTENSTS